MKPCGLIVLWSRYLDKLFYFCYTFLLRFSMGLNRGKARLLLISRFPLAIFVWLCGLRTFSFRESGLFIHWRHNNEGCQSYAEAYFSAGRHNNAGCYFTCSVWRFVHPDGYGLVVAFAGCASVAASARRTEQARCQGPDSVQSYQCHQL